MSNSKSSSTTSTTTNTSYEDRSVTAQDSLILGDHAGYQTGLQNLSNVTGDVYTSIQTLDAEVAKTAIDSATSLGLTAMSGSADIIKTLSADYSAGHNAILNYSDSIIRQTGEQFAAASAGESGRLTAAIGESVQTGLVVAGLAVVAVAAIYFFKHSKK